MNTKKFIPCIYLYQKQALEGPDKGGAGDRSGGAGRILCR